MTILHTLVSTFFASKVLDATLKEITSALLESDVNVKLVASLRQKVKAKAKAIFEGHAEKSKDTNRRNVLQKVSFTIDLLFNKSRTLARLYLTNL
jgi:signal recognition particle GTPase